MHPIKFVRAASSIAASGPIGTMIVNHLITRQQDRKIETVSRLRHICGKGTERKEVIRVLRDFEAHGLGTYRNKSKANDSRLVWLVVND